MSIIDVKIYNLLVHYGFKYEKNLLDLLDEGLLEKMIGGEEFGRPGHKMYAHDVEIKEYKGKTFLIGFLSRASTLKWKYVPGPNRKHVRNPGAKDVLPHSRFFLDLTDHRLFWATERGITYSPSAFHFASFIRSAMISQLADTYREEAMKLWKSAHRPKGIKRHKFISQYLAEHNVTRNTFKIELIPEVSKDKIIDLLKKKNMLLKCASFFPNMNNVTKAHLEKLFTTAAELGAESGAKSEVKLNPADPKAGLNKEPIFNLMNLNDKAQLLTFEFTIKDTNKPNERSFKIANTNPENASRVQKAEVVEANFEEDNILDEVARKADYLEPRGQTADERRGVRAKIRELLRR